MSGLLFAAAAPGTDAQEVARGPALENQAKVLIHSLKETNSVCAFLLCFEVLMW